MHLIRATAFLLCIVLSDTQAQRADRDHTVATPEILVTALRAKQWQVRYDFDEPVARMVFARSPDDSRVKTWLPDQGFEIAATDAGEVARRKDGATFRTVRFRLSPGFRLLPNDYAPFAPFGDGGMLFHSGRVFACAESCPADSSWRMTLWAAPEDRIVLDAAEQRGNSRWTDRGEGRVVYVGSSAPVQAPDTIALLDQALPDSIRSQLARQLPAFMQIYTQRLAKLARPPMLFVSYDVSPYVEDPDRWGSQGGVLPGQIFIHFYGARWPEKLEERNVADWLSWHFAHEAAHLYQKAFSTQPEEHWIHEGAAEAFAAIVLQSIGADDTEFARSKIEDTKTRCHDQLAGRTIRDALTAGTSQVAYTCGMLVHLQIDAQIRRTTNRDGIFAVWRDYSKSAAPSEDAYLAAITAAGNAQLGEWVRQIIRNLDPDFAWATPAQRE